MRRLAALACLAWLVGLAWLVAPGVAHAQTQSPLPCVPPVTVCQTQPPGASPSPSRTPTRGPSPTAAPTPTPGPTTTPDPGLPPLPSPLPPPSGSPAASAVSPSPSPSPSMPDPEAPSASPSASVLRPISLSRPFGLSAATLLLVPVGLAAFAARSRRSSVNLTRRWQLLAGAGCIALAAVVAFVGWYKIAGEPLVNFQVPLLASAGMLVVLLAAVGGSLLVAEQLRAGDRRIAELEEAVRSLAAALAPYVEEPPRR